jgi:hypothetical protein
MGARHQSAGRGAPTPAARDFALALEADRIRRSALTRAHRQVSHNTRPPGSPSSPPTAGLRTHPGTGYSLLIPTARFRSSTAAVTERARLVPKPCGRGAAPPLALPLEAHDDVAGKRVALGLGHLDEQLYETDNDGAVGKNARAKGLKLHA